MEARRAHIITLMAFEIADFKLKYPGKDSHIGSYPMPNHGYPMKWIYVYYE